MLGENEIIRIARYLCERQMQAIGEGLLQVVSRWDGPAAISVAPAGIGAFVASGVAGRIGLEVLRPDALWGAEGVALPAAAVARLLGERLRDEAGPKDRESRRDALL